MKGLKDWSISPQRREEFILSVGTVATSPFSINEEQHADDADLADYHR